MVNTHFPLLDLHRHLDGNVRLQTILELGQQFSIALPNDSLGGLRPHVQVMEIAPDLVSFLNKLTWGVKVLGSLEACKRVAIENVEDAAKQGIDYAELRFSPYFMAESHGLPTQGVVEAVIDGVKSATKDYDVKINLIGILSRSYGVKACQNELNAIIACKEDITAIDLAGDEKGFPGELFVEHFKQVKREGLQITIHAGEAAGPESIWQAINGLGASRIGHGVNAIHDRKLMDHLRDHHIGIESCLTSNILTNTVASLPQHPLKTFLEHGILASINTDDPAVQGIELDHELSVAAKQAGLTPALVNKAQENALAMAFLSESEKAILKAKRKQSRYSDPKAPV
ncbi:adenosine deaminase [Alteromonas sp. KUL106]|uniref:adenosine deaminase n=1 Tax=Alteromonas sp. KUL106 TaxID=2480799 RepID=UPI0012E4045A|nr:adenosine deaminase [Alteromonas sp. KUL106]GFD66913.1 adenosine deaminase [Alteromonas sp. KUL106]